MTERDRYIWNTLLAVVRKALWGGKKVVVNPEDVMDLVEEAKMQTVAGITANTILSDNEYQWEHRKKVMELISIVRQVKTANETVDKEVAGFSWFFNRHEIHFFVVKGQTVAQLYPQPSLREPGDVDFYVAKNDFDRALDKIQVKTQVTKEEGEKHYNFSSGEVAYEMHTQMARFCSEKMTAYFNDLMEKEATEMAHFVEISGKQVPTLSPTVNVVYLFVHLYHHFIGAGVGLRQLCDWALFMHANKDKIDREKLKEILDAIEEERPFKAFGATLVNLIGMPEDDFPLPLSDEDRKWSSKIEKYIHKGGNFGRNRDSKKKEKGLTRSFMTAFEIFKMVKTFHCLDPNIVKVKIQKRDKMP